MTKRAVVAGAILIAVTVVALAQSWNRWLDPIIDTGRDLYISEQISHGSKLYRDFRYQYPPLTPYVLAAATKITGASLAAFTAIGVAQSLAIAALLLLALRKSAGFAAALLFLSLSFAGASTWGANFMFPYAYAATIGMLFITGALAAVLRGREWVAVVCLIAASWCKIEYAAAAMLVVAILTMARQLRIAHAAAYAGSMFMTALAAIAYFGPAMQANVFMQSLTKGEVARHFFANVSGFLDWKRGVAIACASAAAIALIAWLFRSGSKLAIPAVVIAALFFTSDSFFRGWAILQFAALLYGFKRRDSTLTCLAAFSIASTLRVALHVSPFWYGCALVVPVYALAAHVLFASEFRSEWWFVIIAGICLRDLAQQNIRYGVKTYPIATQRGVIYDYNADRARILSEVVRTVRGPTLSVFPEGASINYFTRTTTPLTYYMFTPPETADAQTEAGVIAELRAHPPAEVLLVSRNVSEYRSRGFGADYNVALFRYLLEKHSVERSWTSPQFQAVLLRDMSP